MGFDQKIARRTAMLAWRSFAAEADSRPVVYAGRNLDTDVARPDFRTGATTGRARVRDQTAAALAVPTWLSEGKHTLVLGYGANSATGRTGLNLRARFCTVAGTS